MIPGFGNQSIRIGSDPSCEVVLQAPGVQPDHARIVHEGGGKLTLVALGPGITATLASAPQPRPLAPQEQVAFDFRTAFAIGATPIPLAHPAIVLLILAQGQASAQRGQLVIGRDPTRASLVLQHPSVSSQHATFAGDRMMVIDHGSTSGTFVGANRSKLTPNEPTPVDPNGLVAFGSVTVPVALLAQLAHAAHGGGVAAGAQHPVAAAAAPAGGMAPPKKNKTILGQLDFGANNPVRTIGRTPDNDIVISHPQVSSRHAKLHQSGTGLFIEDCGSANGTFVRGQRVPPGQRVAVQSGEKIYIGPMPLQIELSGSGSAAIVQEEYAADRWAGKPLYEIEAWSLRLEVPDRDNRAQMKTLLDDVSFKALPGDMIALMGPSGAGKTTLLMTLNGYLPPTGGVVRINGEDLYSIYDTLRGSIGYVPQDDLVHPELTVFEAVRYSAKFRLPPDYSDAEIDARVEQTLKDLGLDGVKNLQIGKPEKKVLSGGQRKRVNIALELVTDPVILFLDEPTSGLAADDTTALIELLSNLTKATGKTIIMTIHQPAKDEFEKFTHALIMGYGGIPMFFGPTSPDAYRFFGGFKPKLGLKDDVDNPRDMFDVLAQRERPLFERMKTQNPNASRQEARKVAALEWRAEFFHDSNPTYRRMYSGRREIGSGQGSHGLPPGRPATRGQLFLLVSRYLKTKLRDVGGTVIMFAQAPIIGALLWMVFGWQKRAVPGWCLGAMQELTKRSAGDAQAGTDVLKSMVSTDDHTAAIFFLVVSAIWFGTSNAAREIVSERAIYMRERMVNLGLFSYVMSKYLLLALFCALQCAMLLGIVFFGLGFQGGVQAFGTMLGALISTSLAATALGLLLSTAVESSEAAMALTPIALIPQVILGGLMVPTTTVPHLKPLFYAIPARWGFEATVLAQRDAIADEPAWLIDLQMKQPVSNAADFIKDGRFECAVAQIASDNYPGAWGFTTYETTWLPFAVLGGFTLTLIVALIVILKRRDPV
jgi:ABC-type multidrug transport system ATPase subunit/pSer/pThr/pTyr-binding forkhead associated (FHA) protein